MRILLHCSSFIRAEQERDLLLAWFNLARKLNGEAIDILVVDSASPIDPRGFLPGKWNYIRCLDDDHVPIIGPGNTLLSFKDSLGHPNHDRITERSGPDRAWMRAIECAIVSGYDLVCYIEYDLLCVRPLQWAFQQMRAPVATGGPVPHCGFDEVGYFIAHTEYLWKSNFVRRFNWKGPTWPFGEVRMMHILGNDRQVLPIRGVRDDGQTTPATFHQHFPEGLDYITHATEETYKHFLIQNGHGECWPGQPRDEWNNQLLAA